ncbi:MAG: hypothetical protein ACLPVY_18665 [Acidimicrobiia bacterium]
MATVVAQHAGAWVGAMGPDALYVSLATDSPSESDHVPKRRRILERVGVGG